MNHSHTRNRSSSITAINHNNKRHRDGTNHIPRKYIRQHLLVALDRVPRSGPHCRATDTEAIANRHYLLRNGTHLLPLVPVWRKFTALNSSEKGKEDPQTIVDNSSDGYINWTENSWFGFGFGLSRLGEIELGRIVNFQLGIDLMKLGGNGGGWWVVGCGRFLNAPNSSQR